MLLWNFSKTAYIIKLQLRTIIVQSELHISRVGSYRYFFKASHQYLGFNQVEKGDDTHLTSTYGLHTGFLCLQGIRMVLSGVHRD